MSDYNNDRLIELTNDNERLRRELAELPIALELVKTWRQQAERLERELAEVKSYWFTDADPVETEFAREYTTFLARTSPNAPTT